MKALFTLLFAALILTGCQTTLPRSNEQADRVLKTKNYWTEAFDALEPMDGVFSAMPFHSVNLPKVDDLLFVRGLNAINIAINSTGEVSIARSSISVHELSAIISKIVADGATKKPGFDVVVGADENTPFSKVWPVLLACCTKGVWKVGLAVSAGQQEYMNILRVYLPKTTNALYPSPLALRADTEITIIGVQTNGITLARYKGAEVSDRKWIGKEPYPGCIHEADIPPLGDIDTDSTVAIVPAQDATYGQVARLVYWCRRFRQASICLFREDAIAVLENTKK